MISRRTLLGSGLCVGAAVTLTGCGANSDPFADQTGAPVKGQLAVGSASFTENVILANVYALALQAQRLTAPTKLNLTSREVYLPALRDGSISIIPEYTGNLLLYLDQNATATTAAEVQQALPAALGAQLKILTPSKATDQDVYVVTREFSESNGVRSLADLAKVATEITLGGPTELKERAYGPPGLAEIYGAKIKGFTAYSSPAVKVRDLKDGKIQLATFFTTESAIADNGFVSLADPQSMILPQNIVPLVRADFAANQTAVEAVEAVQAALTTEELTALNKMVDGDRQDPGDVAARWLASKGLG